ncbi:MAG: hypothetical protein KDC76_14610 [Bacteroidetes bacterium]|nr:hypothetical protein [Bacteroidota bacterium]
MPTHHWWTRALFLLIFYSWLISTSTGQISRDGYWMYFPELGLAPDQAQKILVESGIRMLAEEMGDSLFNKNGSLRKVKFTSYTEYYFNENGLPYLIKTFDHRRRLIQTSSYQFFRDSFPFKRYDINSKGDTVMDWSIQSRRTNPRQAIGYFKKNKHGKIVERMTTNGDASYRMVKRRFGSTIWETDYYHKGEIWMCRKTSPTSTSTNKYYSLAGEVTLCRPPFKETVEDACDTITNFQDTLRIQDQAYLHFGFQHEGSKRIVEVLAQPKGGVQPNLGGLHRYSSSPNVQEIHQYNPSSGWMMNSQYNYFSNNHLDSVTEYRYSKPFGVEIHTHFNTSGQLISSNELYYQNKNIGALSREDWLNLKLPTMTWNFQGNRNIQRSYLPNGLLDYESDYQSILKKVSYRKISYHEIFPANN